MAKVSATVCNVEQSRTSFHVCTCAPNWRNLMWPINCFDRVPETPAATVLHNKSFLRAAATTYFSTPYVAHSSAHVFLSFLCTTTTMPRRVDSEFKQYTDCMKQYITKKMHLASDTRMTNAVVRAVKTENYQVDGE